MNLQTGKTSFNDVATFYLLPVPLSGLLVWFYWSDLLVQQADALLSAVSIIGGFLFALFAYIVTVIDRLHERKVDDVVQHRFSREIHRNIAYAIIVSLLCICVLLGVQLLHPRPVGWEYYGRKVYLFVTYFLLLHFLFTLIYVIRRVFIVIESRFS